MLRLLLFIFLTILLYTIFQLLSKDLSSSRKRPKRDQEPEELVQDPYCRTYIPKRLAIKKRMAGQDRYFCNQDCLRNYNKDNGPDRP